MIGIAASGAAPVSVSDGPDCGLGSASVVDLRGGAAVGAADQLPARAVADVAADTYRVEVAGGGTGTSDDYAVVGFQDGSMAVLATTDDTVQLPDLDAVAVVRSGDAGSGVGDAKCVGLTPVSAEAEPTGQAPEGAPKPPKGSTTTKVSPSSTSTTKMPPSTTTVPKTTTTTVPKTTPTTKVPPTTVPKTTPTTKVPPTTVPKTTTTTVPKTTTTTVPKTTTTTKPTTTTTVPKTTTTTVPKTTTTTVPETTTTTAGISPTPTIPTVVQPVEIPEGLPVTGMTRTGVFWAGFSLVIAGAGLLLLERADAAEAERLAARLRTTAPPPA